MHIRLILTALFATFVHADVSSVCLCTAQPCGPCGLAAVSGSTEGGTRLVLNGVGFSARGNNAVSVGGKFGTVTSYYSGPTQVVVATPTRVAGQNLPINLWVDGYTVMPASPATFTYDSGSTPWVASMQLNGTVLTACGNLTADGYAPLPQLTEVLVGGSICVVSNTSSTADGSC